MPKRILILLTVLVAVLLTESCGKKGVPPLEKAKTSLQIIAGSNQTISAGNLIEPLRVRVIDARNHPVLGDSVRFFQITADRGGKFPLPSYATRVTDSNGYAQTSYYADTLVGLESLQVVAAGADDSVGYFAFIIAPNVAARMLAISGNHQNGPAGDTLPQPLVVKITDRYNNPIPSRLIRFVTFDRSLVVTDSTRLLPFAGDTAYTRTAADGLASSQWILPADPSLGFSGMNAYSLNNDLTILDSVLADALLEDPGPLHYYPNIRPIFSQHCQSCHSGPDSLRYHNYPLGYYYYDLLSGGNDAVPNLIPGDPSCLLVMEANSDHFLNTINIVETDKIYRWVTIDNADPGSSGLNCYYGKMQNIFNTYCISCHNITQDSGSYDLSSFNAIRGNGTDATPNVIPGDISSLLSQRVAPGGNMRYYLGLDSLTLADSIIHWIVRDSIRDY
jgi:hypothetical protein